MRLGRVLEQDEISYAVIENDKVRLLECAPYDGLKWTGAEVPLSKVRLLSPVTPGKIVAVGLNYQDHIREMNHENVPEDPVIFLKPPSAVIGPEDEIVRPTHMSSRVDFEGELAVVIKKRCHRVKKADISQYILGYTCLNDVTARDLQKKDGQWIRAKGFDTFSPIGPWIETELDADQAKIETRLNGKTMQKSTTAHMIRSVDELVSFISDVMTLEPGDVIATGTPSGIGPMVAGDTVEVEIEGIGVLKNVVRDA